MIHYGLRVGTRGANHESLQNPGLGRGDSVDRGAGKAARMDSGSQWYDAS
jgi:hypothetical protein